MESKRTKNPKQYWPKTLLFVMESCSPTLGVFSMSTQLNLRVIPGVLFTSKLFVSGLLILFKFLLACTTNNKYYDSFLPVNIYIVPICIIAGALSMLSVRGCESYIRLRECLGNFPIHPLRSWERIVIMKIIASLLPANTKKYVPTVQ